MKYWLTVRYGARDGSTYTINAKNDDEFRKVAIAKYGTALIRSMRDMWGNTVQREDRNFTLNGELHYFYIGDFYYTNKRWYWDFGKTTQFEIDPVTGGKMNRYIEGYEVRYVTKSGTPVKKNLKYEGIEFTRFALMNYDTYKDAKRNFTLYKAGKKLGTLILASNGKWLWTTASGSKYYVYRENGQISSQKR